MKPWKKYKITSLQNLSENKTRTFLSSSNFRTTVCHIWKRGQRVERRGEPEVISRKDDVEQQKSKEARAEWGENHKRHLLASIPSSSSPSYLTKRFAADYSFLCLIVSSHGRYSMKHFCISAAFWRLSKIIQERFGEVSLNIPP